jgi:MATE family multidrug resistance protein
MTLAHLSTPLLGGADAAIIGRLGQAHLLGAIASAAIMFNFLFWSFGFLRMGTAGLTAQALGACDAAEQRAPRPYGGFCNWVLNDLAPGTNRLDMHWRS